MYSKCFFSFLWLFHMDRILFAGTLSRACSCVVIVVVVIYLFVFGSIQRRLSYGSELKESKKKLSMSIWCKTLIPRQLANKYWYVRTFMPYIHVFWLLLSFFLLLALYNNKWKLFIFTLNFPTTAVIHHWHFFPMCVYAHKNYIIIDLSLTA